MSNTTIAGFEVTCKTCKRKLETEFPDPDNKLAVRLICPTCKARVRMILGG